MKRARKTLVILITAIMVLTGSTLDVLAISDFENADGYYAAGEQTDDQAAQDTEADVQADEDGQTADDTQDAEENALSRQTLEKDDVILKGMMPEKAAADIKDAVDEKDVKALKKELKEDGRIILAAYNITVRGGDNEFRPDKDEPVSIVIKNDAIEKDSDLKMIRLKDDEELNEEKQDGDKEKYENTEEIKDITVKDGKVSFDAEKLGVYVIAVPEEDEDAQADADLTKQTLKDGNVSLKGMMPENAEAEAKDASGKKAVKALKGDDEIILAAYDITIKDGDNKFQPAKDEPINVVIRSNAIEKDSDLKIIHIKDNGKTEKIKDFTVKDGRVSFDATGFSVYVVIDEEEGTVENPRVKFHFIDKDAAEHTDSDSGVYYAGDPYHFKNSHGDDQTSQILKDGESLELIKDPENENGKNFYGWYIVDPAVVDGTDEYGIGTSDSKLYYTWPANPDKLFFGSNIEIQDSNVSIGDMVHWKLHGVSGSGKVDSDGNVHVFVAPVYEKYKFVNFMLYARNTTGVANTNSVMARKLVVTGSAETLNVKISDIRSTSTDAKHLIFVGWEYNAGTEADPDWRQIQTVDYTGDEIKEPGKDGTYLETELEGQSIDLYPIFVEARWVDFVSGLTGSGANYIASRFLESWSSLTPAGTPEIDGRNIFTSFDTPTRKGYKFNGWYAFAVTDPDTGEITNLTEPADVTINYVDGSNGNYRMGSVTINTTAVKIANADGTIAFNGEYSVTDSSGEHVLFSAEDGKLKFYNALDRLTLYADWAADDSKITVIYWTENAQDKGYTAPANEKDDYSASAVKTLTTADLNDQLGTNYASGSTLTLNQLGQYKENNVSILSTDILDEAGAVEEGEEKFYDRNDSLSDTSVVINGDGSTMVNVYFSRKTFKLAFHIGRDGYVKQNGQQKPEFMTRPEYSNWDGNWIQFMFNDSKITNPVESGGLGYTPGPTASSYSGTFTMTYTDPDTGVSTTYDSNYQTTTANVMGDYDPVSDTDLYVIEAKYGAYIGDKWPTPVNPNFEFSYDSKRSMYIWAAYYGSLYCRIANERSNYGNTSGNNPDINGIYNYMSAELCSNRAGDDIINENQVHHLVAYYGNTGKAGIIKNYHILYEAIDGTYDPDSVTVQSGNDYLGYGQTTWSDVEGSVSAVDGHYFYEASQTQVISNLEPQFQLGYELDGYDLVYSCYNTPSTNDHHIYFFYRPKRYSLTFMYENEEDRKTDTYYYSQTLKDAKKYDDPEKEGYLFKGWYTNEAGIGEPFDFANETMPSSNEVLYPVMSVIQYKTEIDPNGGVIDHINYDRPDLDQYGITANQYGVEGSGYNRSQATYFNADYGTPIGEYTVERNYVQLTEKELDPDSATYYIGTKYYYVNEQFNEQFDGDWGLPPDLRNAVYMDETQLRKYYDYYCAVVDANAEYYTGVTKLSWTDFCAAYTSYPDRPYRTVTNEHYTFMGWYQVYDDGSVDTMPYNFNDPMKGPLKLRALWRLDGGYYVQYNSAYYADDGSGNVTVVGEEGSWTDPENPNLQLYADQSNTNVLHAPANDNEDWVFRGWRVVRANGTKTYTDPDTGETKTYTEWEPIQFDSNGDVIYYQPGDNFTVDSDFVTEMPQSGVGAIIHMQAYYEPADSSYRRPKVTNLTLDANDTYGGYVNTSDSTGLPALDGPGRSAINTATEQYEGHPTQILLGDFQANIALHLYRYATTDTHNGIQGTSFFDNTNGYTLIGFDENSDPESPKTGKAYVPTYAPDSVASVTRNDNRTLYAMWEPMIYVTFVNTTDEPITIDLSGSGADTVSIVNIVTGEFEREQASTTITVPARSGNKDGTVKIALPKAAAGTDSITATAVNDHIGKKVSVSGEYQGTSPYGTGSENVKYGNPVTYTGTLQNGEEGVIVTYTEEPARQVVYDVNEGTWTETSSLYEHLTGDLYALPEENITDNNYKPSDPTRSGKVFLGWTTNADIAAHTDFSSETAVTWGDTTITPDEGSNVLEKVKESYLWDFDQEPPYDQTLYAVWSDAVTVTFNMVYSNNVSASNVKLHTWTGPDTTTTDTPYDFYRDSDDQRYVTYTMAKGDKVPKPSDPTPHSDKSTWNFIKWLIGNSTTDSYRYSAKAMSDGNLTTYGFDFSQPVTSNVQLVTSWTTAQPQYFTFTVENQVINDFDDEEFEYTIAVSNELVLGKLGSSTTNSVGEPDRKWGSVTTTLKNNQQYTVQVTVSYITNWGGGYGIGIDVIDSNGTVVKSGEVIYCNNNTFKNFVSDYRYTLTVTQTDKPGYETAVSVEDVSGIDSNTDEIDSYSVNASDRSFAFNSQHGSTRDFMPYINNIPDINGYAAGEDNSLRVVYTNTRPTVSPTGYHTEFMPYIFMGLFALVLMAAAIVYRRRRKHTLASAKDAAKR